MLTRVTVAPHVCLDILNIAIILAINALPTVIPVTRILLALNAVKDLLWRIMELHAKNVEFHAHSAILTISLSASHVPMDFSSGMEPVLLVLPTVPTAQELLALSVLVDINYLQVKLVYPTARFLASPALMANLQTVLSANTVQRSTMVSAQRTWHAIMTVLALTVVRV